MKRLGLLAIPVLSLLVIGVIASAYPQFDASEMAQEENDLKIQMLEMQQETIQSKLSYLRGEITEEQFKELMQEHMDKMEPLREQFREQVEDRRPDAGGCMQGKGFGGFGR